MPPKSTSGAKRGASGKSSKGGHLRDVRWGKLTNRQSPSEDVGADAGHARKRRRRAVSPEDRACSPSSSGISNKRLKSIQLQATSTSGAEPTPAPQSTSSISPQAPESSYTTTSPSSTTSSKLQPLTSAAKPSPAPRPTSSGPPQTPKPSCTITNSTRGRVQGAQSGRKNEAPDKPTRDRARTPASPSVEDTCSPLDVVQGSGVAQEGLTIGRTVASSIEKTPAATKPNAASSLSRGTNPRRVTIPPNSNPDVVEPTTEAEVDSIDFGALVPEGEPNEGVIFRLQLPNDGVSCKTLRVGRDEQCDIKLEEQDIGDVFYSLELVLQSNPGQYKRIVRVNSAESDNSAIISQQGISPQRCAVLQEGSIVTFGVNSKIRYRYLPPQVPLPEPMCWATRLFNWDSTIKPNFGGARSNSSVYLVTNRKSGSRHAMKVIQTIRFSFNPALSSMVRREREALSVLKHPHVLELQLFRRDDVHSRIMFIFPEMEGGNIFDFVVKNRLPQNQRRLNNFAPQVAKDLLSGLAFIHSKDIVHRDLKPEDVFLAEAFSEGAQEYPTVVIGDFGIARLPGERRTEMYDGGSSHWLSPISFRDPKESETDFPIDLWGVALIIWFMLAGLPKPWGQAGAPEDPKETNQLRWGLLEELKITAECTDFLEGFLVDHPDQCRTLEGAESHPWIQSGVTVDPNEGEKGVDFAALLDLHAQPESGETQVEFDDEY